MQIIVCQSRQELSTQWTLWSLATTGLSIVFTKPGGAGFLPPENLQVDECSQGATLLSKPILYGITDGVFREKCFFPNNKGHGNLGFNLRGAKRWETACSQFS